MELQQLRYVLAVAETGNFTRAAARCLVVQSALSHQVARLEKELGARLFDRHSRGVRLTAAGEAFLPAARQALAAVDRARDEVAAAVGEIRGSLAIGAIPTVTAVDLPRSLREFWVRHPQVRISLRSDMSERLVEQVREGSLDLAFLGVLPGFQPQGVRDLALAEGELVAVLPPGHPLADAGEIGLRRLAEETFADFPAGSAARAQTDQAFSAAGLTREAAFEASAPYMLAQLVRHGLGVAMLPAAYVSDGEAAAGLSLLSVRDAPARVERLIWSRSRPSPAAAEFLRGIGVDPESSARAGGGSPRRG
jgi:DNA-binding transcriptional LysR family regulator